MCSQVTPKEAKVSRNGETSSRTDYIDVGGHTLSCKWNMPMGTIMLYPASTNTFTIRSLWFASLRGPAFMTQVKWEVGCGGSATQAVGGPLLTTKLCHLPAALLLIVCLQQQLNKTVCGTRTTWVV